MKKKHITTALPFISFLVLAALTLIPFRELNGVMALYVKPILDGLFWMVIIGAVIGIWESLQRNDISDGVIIVASLVAFILVIWLFPQTLLLGFIVYVAGLVAVFQASLHGKTDWTPIVGYNLGVLAVSIAFTQLGTYDQTFQISDFQGHTFGEVVLVPMLSIRYVAFSIFFALAGMVAELNRIDNEPNSDIKSSENVKTALIPLLVMALGLVLFHKLIYIFGAVSLLLAFVVIPTYQRIDGGRNYTSSIQVYPNVTNGFKYIHLNFEALLITILGTLLLFAVKYIFLLGGSELHPIQWIWEIPLKWVWQVALKWLWDGILWILNGTIGWAWRGLWSLIGW